MLVAHIDDSGTDGKGHGCVLAGYVATYEQWAAFSKEWSACLSREPSIEHFRMVEANSRRGQFKGWSVPARDTKLSELAAIINRNVSFGAATVVWWDDFSKFEKLIPHPVTVYCLLFNKIIVSIINYMIENEIDDKVEVIFDDQGALGAKAGSIFHQVYLSMSEKYRKRLAGSPVHRDDKYVLPLQAADMIAWNVRRGLTASGFEPYGVANELSGIPTATYVFTAVKLRRIARHAEELAKMYPNIRQMFTAEELAAVRDAFLRGADIK